MSTSEQETVIVIPRDASQPVRISTSDSTMMTRLRNLADPKKNPGTTWKKTESQTVNGEVAEEFYESDDHGTILVRAKRMQTAKRELTEEQRQVLSERMKKLAEQSRQNRAEADR